MNEEERARKREKNIKKRRKARVSIVVDFFKLSFSLFLAPRGWGRRFKKCKNHVGTGEN